MTHRQTRRQILINRWYDNNFRAAKASEREVSEYRLYKEFKRTQTKTTNNEEGC